MKDLIASTKELSVTLDDLVEISGYLWERGWAERNAGNLSMDVTDFVAGRIIQERSRPTSACACSYPDLAGRYYLITGSGRRFRDFAKGAEQNACILRMTEDGGGYRIVWGGAGDENFRPTSEFPAHLRIHELLRKNNSPHRAVIHTHPNELIVLTHMPEFADKQSLNRALWGIHPEVKVVAPEGVGLAPYTLPGSEDLAQQTLSAFAGGHRAIMWALHGVAAVGEAIPEAFDLIDTLNKAAKLILQCRAAGLTAGGLTDEQLAALTDAFHLGE